MATTVSAPALTLPQTLGVVHYDSRDSYTGQSRNFTVSPSPLWPAVPGNAPSLDAAGSTNFQDVLREASQRSLATKNLMGDPVNQAQGVLQATDGAFYLVGLSLDADGKRVPAPIDGPLLAKWNMKGVRFETKHDPLVAVVGGSSWINLSDRSWGNPQPLPR